MKLNMKTFGQDLIDFSLTCECTLNLILWIRQKKN